MAYCVKRVWNISKNNIFLSMIVQIFALIDYTFTENYEKSNEL